MKLSTKHFNLYTLLDFKTDEAKALKGNLEKLAHFEKEMTEGTFDTKNLHQVESLILTCEKEIKHFLDLHKKDYKSNPKTELEKDLSNLNSCEVAINYIKQYVNHFEKIETKVHYAKETAKAVAFEIEMTISEEYTDKYKKFKCEVWCPKSQLDSEGYPAKWIWEKNIEEKFNYLNPFSHWGLGAIVEYDYRVLNNPNFRTFKTEQEIKREAEAKEKLAQREAELQKSFDKAQEYREALVSEIKAKNPKFRLSAKQRIRNSTFETEAKSLGIDYHAIARQVGYTHKDFKDQDYEAIKAHHIKGGDLAKDYD